MRKGNRIKKESFDNNEKKNQEVQENETISQYRGTTG